MRRGCRQGGVKLLTLIIPGDISFLTNHLSGGRHRRPFLREKLKKVCFSLSGFPTDCDQGNRVPNPGAQGTPIAKDQTWLEL
jgi:hypothetical protein